MLEFNKETNDALAGCQQVLRELNDLMHVTPAVLNSLPPTAIKAHDWIVNTRRVCTLLNKYFNSFVDSSAKMCSEVPRLDRHGRRPTITKAPITGMAGLVPTRPRQTSQCDKDTSRKVTPARGEGRPRDVGGPSGALTERVKISDRRPTLSDPSPPINGREHRTYDKSRRTSVAAPQSGPVLGNVGPSMPASSVLSCALHVAVEAVAYATESERATVLIRSDYSGIKNGVTDMQCLCFVGGAPLSTQQIRLSMDGIISTILTSGVALNLSNVAGDSSVRKYDGTGRAGKLNEAHSMLCVPIYPLGHTYQPIGILQLVNKMCSNDAFTPGDEAAAYHAATQLSYILFRYPVTTKCQALEIGKVLHQLVPFGNREHAARHASVLDGDVPRDLVELLEEHVVQPLVFRSRHVEHFMRKGVVATGKAMFLETKHEVQEMGDYIDRLESCWRSTAEEVVIMEKEHAASRTESKKGLVRLKLLEEALAQTEHKCTRYKNEYDKLTGVVNNVLSTALHQPLGALPPVKGAAK